MRMMGCHVLSILLLGYNGSVNMGQNPLRNVGTNDLIAAARDFGFVHSATHGDDAVYVNKSLGAVIKITLNRKDGTPLGTVLNIIRWSGVPKRQWVDWFRKQRNGR